MPDKLPQGWVKTSLGEVCSKPQYGWTTSAAKEGTLKLLRTTDITGGRIDWDTVPFCRQEPPEPDRQLLKDGDIVISRAGSVGFGVRVVSPPRAVFASYLIRFRPANEINGEYVAYFLLSPSYWTQVRASASGIAIPNVNASKLQGFDFPLAPALEQERIVAKLDALLSRLTAGETSARRALERLKRYRAAVLRAAVTGELTRDWRETNKPDETGARLLKRLLRERRGRWEEAELKRLHAAGKPPKDDKWKKRYPEPTEPNSKELPELPRGWVYAGWEQVGFSQNGRPFPSKEYTKAGIKLLRPGNLFPDGSVRWTDKNTRCLPARWERLNPDYVIGDNELVINLTAQSLKDEFLGRVCLTSPGEHCLLNQRLARLTPILGSRRFLLYMFKSPVFRRFVDELNSGSLIQHMFTSQLGDFAFPFPPEEEQAEIVREVDRRLEAGDRLVNTLTRQLERTRVTRQSLLREAFAGELVPQNPNDEPASVLLERIRDSREVEAESRTIKQKSRGARRKQKRIIAMNQIVPTSETLLAAWRKIGKKRDALRLFQAAGYTPEHVVQFYEVLRATPEIRESFGAASKARSRAPKTVQAVSTDEKESKGHFRLVALWLENFKNLKNYEVHLNPSKGLDVVLGWNGTGKSNLFEAFVLVFRDLHYWWEKNQWPDETLGAYQITYEIGEQLIEVTWNPTKMKRPELRRAVIPNAKDINIKFEEIKREDLPLPRFVFGYYSGPTNRLAEHFLPMKRDHYDRLRKASSDDPKTLARLIEQRRFFCAETHHAKYVLLAFAYKEDRKINHFLKARLRITGFESALFVIRRPQWGKGTPANFWGATGIMLRVMEKLRRFAIAPMVVKQNVIDGYRSKHEDHYYFYLPDLKSLHAFAAEYADARSFFVALESTDFSELIYDVKIQVRVKAAENHQIPITFRELSEGEQQLLMVLGLMRFTKSHQSLVLLDEPDTHLNPHWSVDFLKDLASVTSDNDKPSPEQQSSQRLMATHDPLVIASLLKDQVHLLRRDRDSLRCYSERASENPRGLGFTGILLSDMFGFRSDLDEETLVLLDRQVRLAGKAKRLSSAENSELSRLNKKIEELGFKTVSSDPYYRAFIEGLNRRQEALALIQKPVQTVKERTAIRKAADEILAELAKKHELTA